MLLRRNRICSLSFYGTVAARLCASVPPPPPPTGSAPADPKPPAEAPKVAADDAKKPETPKASDIAKGISPAENPPKGFEKFFTRELLSRTIVPTNVAEGIKSARTVTADEVEIIRAVEEFTAKMRRYRRMTVLAFVVGMIASYRYYQRALLASGSVEEYAFVVADIPNHIATFYDKSGKTLGIRSFVEFRSFEASVDAAKDVLINVSTYYPWVPMMLLLLLPVLSGLNSGFNASARMAAKHAQSGVGDKSKFNFKREVGISTRLKDVAGLTEAKHEVVEVIDFLKHPARYRALGAKLPKGVLLDGPPGVGKTLLAKAVAGEAMVPFVSCSGSEFEEVFVGVGAQRVRELFKQAHKSKPCVVFIDEIDAFGKKRKTDGGGSSRSTLNAFLSELDGFHDSAGIIVLAATNRADVLDNALTRSGRFDRKITLEKPPHKDRVAIAQVHLKPLKLDPAVTIEAFAETVASLTPGCSGADIFNICNEAAIIASRDDKEWVNVQCFHKALERVLVGMEKQAVKLTANERERIAYHEAGHVVLSWFLETVDPVVKTTIAPRGGNMTGVTQKLPQSVYISTQQRIRESMIARLGGFTAEEHFFQDLSSNAAEDLQRVTDTARDELCRYGMEPEHIGHFGFNMDQDNAIQKPFGPKKENMIDEAIARIVDDCVTKAKALMQEHLMDVRKVAGLLLKQETLSAQELWVVLGDRPNMSPEFRKYLQS